MNYFRCRWLHDFPDEPVWLISELDDERWETRKVWVFADGSKAYASATEEVGIGLSDQPVPPLSEIAADPQFVPEEIAKEVFEEAWNMRATRADPAAPGFPLSRE